MSRSVNKIESISFVIMKILHLYGMALNGYATLSLKVHIIEHLGLQVLTYYSACGLEQTVGKCAFAVVNMGNNAEIPDFVHVQFFNFFAKIVQIERKNNKLA